ncbi:MAG: DUF2628 domain-containing protein [Proteobacteria bacterium]|nr:DUF2628 domain-containing protein [Pseudomonadota bacterium]
MDTFRIYKHPLLGWAAVKVGFNWFAFLLGVLWLLVARLWKQAALLFAFTFAFNLIVIPSPDSSISEGGRLWVDIFGVAVTIGVAWFIGNNANRWRRINLKSRGYILINSVQAENKDAALALADQALADEIASETEEDSEQDSDAPTEAVKKQIK